MKSNLTLAPLAAAALLTLAACGGSDGDDAAPPPAASELAIAGTAAEGTAIAGAAVGAKCAVGTGSTTTGADGSYSLRITDGQAPCMLELTRGADKFYSMVAPSDATSGTANLTPLSTLMAWDVANGDPATLYASFDAVAQSKLGSEALGQARQAVQAALAGRVALDGIDPLTTPFKVGDATDAKLGELKAVLAAAGTNLATVAAALAQPVGTGAPLARLLAPGAAGCKWLKSGKYHVLNTRDSSEPGNTIDIDASALSIVTTVGETFTFTDAGSCRFEFPNDDGTLLVSPSGLAVVRQPISIGAAQRELLLVVPAEEVALADLAGDWNFVGYTGGSAFASWHGSFKLDASGAVTGGLDCTGLDDCRTVPESATERLTPRAGGGFDLAEAGELVPWRVFALRGTTGEPLLVIQVDGYGEMGILIASPRVARLPVPVGTVTPFSLLSMGSGGYVGEIRDDVSTVTASTAEGFTRTVLDGHAETFTLNKPRDGLRYRPAGSSLDSSGASVSFNEVIGLRPPGFGVTFTISVASSQSFLTVAVDRPAP